MLKLDTFDTPSAAVTIANQCYNATYDIPIFTIPIHHGILLSSHQTAPHSHFEKNKLTKNSLLQRVTAPWRGAVIPLQ